MSRRRSPTTTASSIDEAIAFMNDRDAAFCAKPKRLHNQLRQQAAGLERACRELARSDRHSRSSASAMKTCRPTRSGTLTRALAFAGRPATDERDRPRRRLCRFCRIAARRSRTRVFARRRAPGRAEAFFRRGEAGRWRDELTPEQVARIEAAHAPMMRRLGYELSSHAPRWSRSA